MLSDMLLTLARWFSYIIRTTWVILNNIYSISAYTFYVILASPLHFIRPDLLNRIEGIMYNWLLAMVAWMNWSTGEI